MQQIRTNEPLAIRVIDILSNSIFPGSRNIMDFYYRHESFLNWFRDVVVFQRKKPKGYAFIIQGPKSSGKTCLFDIISQLVTTLYLIAKVNNYNLEPEHPHLVELLMWNEVDWREFCYGSNFRGSLETL